MIIVMLIITCTIIFALSLSAMAVNSRKQINKIDKTNVATDIAEMGITYVSKNLSSSLPAINSETRAELLDYLLDNYGTKKGKPFTSTDIENKFNGILKQKIDNFFANSNITSSIKVEQPENNFTITQPSVTFASPSVSASFKSTGKVNTETKVVTATLPLIKTGSSSIPSTPDPSNGAIEVPKGNKHDDPAIEYNEINVKDVDMKGNRQLVVNNNAYINGVLKMEGTSDLLVGGNAVITDMDIKGNSTLFVFGDLLLKEELDKHDLNGSLNICVLGKTYSLNSQQQIIENPTLNGKNICASISGKNQLSIDISKKITVDYTQ